MSAQKKPGSAASITEEVAVIHRQYAPTAREWLGTEIAYQGIGEAEFVTNPGTVRGTTAVRYGEDGSLAHFEMTVDELVAKTHPGKGAPDAPFAFINGLPVPGKPGSFVLGGRSNKCVRVEVHGEGVELHVAQRADVIASAGDRTVEFEPYRTIARYRTAAAPRYWAVPLLNFVSKFALATTDLQGHPLRTRETRTLEQLGDESDRYRTWAYQSGNALIPFVCEGELGFIESLADYEARVARVEGGETVATAVMVGRLPDKFDPAADEDWFPADVVTLLGLATGRGVGVPFVELRGSAGELVARMHTSIGSPSTQKRTSLVDESFDRSTGALVSAFLSSEHSGRTWLRVVLKHLLSAFTGDMTVEDRLGHLFRATEGLCVGLRLNRSRPLELVPEIREQVTQRLDECLASLNEIAQAAKPEDRERIAKLKNQLRQVKANQPSFATQLLGLVRYAELPDAEWLAGFRFRSKLDGRPVRWAAVASDYRNKVFHSAFIDFDSYDIDNAAAFTWHLADVLARAVFHVIGFNGKYKLPCGSHGMVAHEHPDWATPDRLSSDLLRYVE